MRGYGGLVSRWMVFIRERYEPVTHGVMAMAFALGNAGAAAHAVGARPGVSGLACAGLLVVVFFFRLRIYDEVKDYRTDLVAHPQRPLPRGVISPDEARRAAWILAWGELVLVALAGGWWATWAWAAAFLYSLAMYREFGVGAWLRPRMELYALSHTVVAALLGIVVGCLALDQAPWRLMVVAWVMAPANWALFNIFEFSRKTFGPREEPPGEGSYSRRWGPRGAVVLTLAWAAVAIACLAAGGMRLLPGLGLRDGALMLGLVAGLLAAPYAARPGRGTARLMRASMPGWATAVYLLLAVAGLGGS